MKNLIKSWLSALFGPEITGLVLRQRTYRKAMKAGYFGLNDIDKKLEILLPHRKGFYVELGANDGAFQSNSFFFELKKGWSGVLVEPAPNLFLSCVKRRGARNHVAPYACVPFGYKGRFVSMSYGNAMTISLDLDLDLDNPDKHMILSEKFLPRGETKFEFGARAASLDSILKEAGAPSDIDFLSLDVEGAELAVLQGVDFDAYRFRYMVIESRNPNRLRDFLEPLGYRLIEKIGAHDYLFGSLGGELQPEPYGYHEAEE